MGEQIILDGLSLNDDNPWYIRGDSFNFAPARKKLNWVSSAMSDGASLAGDEDHYENAELTFTARCRPQPSKDEALGAWNALTQKLQAARPSKSGIPLVWIPDQSAEATTWYVVDAEYDELHTSFEGGWFDNAPEVAVHLYMRPFGHGPEEILPLGYTDPFSFNSILGGQWRWANGTGTAAVSGGYLTFSSTANKRLYLPFTAESFTVAERFFFGATLGSGNSLVMKWLDATHYLRCGCGVAELAINRVITTESVLATQAYTFTANTWYWQAVSFAGDDITVAVYDGNDSDLTTPLASVSWTLTGTDATTFGSGIRGYPGISTTPASLDWLIDLYRVRGMDDIQSSNPLIWVEIPDVKGHASAEGRQLVTEASAVARRHYEWGLEARDYDSDDAWPMILDSDALDVTGYAGVQTTTGGGDIYDPHAAGTDSIVFTSLSEVAAVTICTTGGLGHVGVYKVKARVFGTAGVKVRLAYEVGDAVQRTRNAYTSPIEGTYQEVDLGTIVIPPVAIGNQAWVGWIEAYGVNGGTIGVDYLMLIPVERYGRIKEPLRVLVPDVFAARDAFDQASNPALDALALPIAPSDTGPVSGKWHGFGDSDDFTVDSTLHLAQRTAVSDTNTASGRYAVVGNAAASNFTNIQVRADTKIHQYAGTGSVPANISRFGVLARYTDTNNWLGAFREPYIGDALGSRSRLRVYKKVAGVTTQLASYDIPAAFGAFSTMTTILTVNTSGVWQVFIFAASTTQPFSPVKKGEDTALATGGALATGKVGIYDGYSSATASVRTFDNFSAFAAGGEVILASSRKLQIRSDRAEREGAANYYGQVVAEGSNFFIPAAGDRNGVTRLVSKARRTNVDEGLPDTNVADDAHILQVFGTPRYLHP